MAAGTAGAGVAPAGGSRDAVVERVSKVKVQASVKPRCDSCKVIRRERVVMVICKKNPKHKQRQG